MNYPFLDVLPGRDVVFRTKVRLTETFDSVGVLNQVLPLPSYKENATVGADPWGLEDYGVFEFGDLFSERYWGRPCILTRRQIVFCLISRVRCDRPTEPPFEPSARHCEMRALWAQPTVRALFGEGCGDPSLITVFYDPGRIGLPHPTRLISRSL